MREIALAHKRCDGFRNNFKFIETLRRKHLQDTASCLSMLLGVQFAARLVETLYSTVMSAADLQKDHSVYTSREGLRGACSTSRTDLQKEAKATS